MEQTESLTTDRQPAFRLVDVSRSVDDLSLLDRVNLTIPRREFTALIGPSGSGKTSLLRLLNRLDDPSSGDIYYHERSIVDIPVREHRTRVGYVFQTPVMFAGTVADNLSVAAEIAGVPKVDVEQRMVDSLRLAEVDTGLFDRDAARLSVGQQQRVSLARTLMTKPETLLLDEPTASLDPQTADKLMTTIAHLAEENGVTVVAATHRLTEAKRISQYLVMMDAGRIVTCGPSARLFQASDNPRLQQFLETMA